MKPGLSALIAKRQKSNGRRTIEEHEPVGFDPYAVEAGPGLSVEELVRLLDEAEHPLRERFGMSAPDLRRQLPLMLQECTVDESEDIQRWLSLLTEMMESAEAEARTRPPPVEGTTEQAEGPHDAALFFVPSVLAREAAVYTRGLGLGPFRS